MDERVEGGVYRATISRHGHALGTLIVGTILGGYMAFHYLTALANRSLLVALIGLPGLGLTALILHRGLVALVNLRTARVGDGRVVFRSEPIPFAGNLDAPLAAVDSFGTVARSGRGYSAQKLVAHMADGTRRGLGYLTTDPAEMAYVVDQLNEALRRARRDV